MKKLIVIIACLSSGFLFAQAEKKTESFKVYGNCEMCQENIEGALKKKDGILSKSWDTETKMLKVTYDPSKISLDDIKRKIAAVGYDSDGMRGSDEAYMKLHKCCRYERATIGTDK